MLTGGLGGLRKTRRCTCRLLRVLEGGVQGLGPDCCSGWWCLLWCGALAAEPWSGWWAEGQMGSLKPGARQL